MALQYPVSGEPIQIADEYFGTLGRTTVPMPDVDFLGWADHEHLMVRTDHNTLQVVTLAGEVTREVPLLDSRASEVHIGSSEGITPDAAELTFDVR
jgi:hypothetical protein